MKGAQAAVKVKGGFVNQDFQRKVEYNYEDQMRIG